MNAPVAVAAALDIGLREPPAAVHPVVWMGRYLGTAERVVPAGPRRSARVRGGAAWALGAGVTWGLGRLVDAVACRLPPTLGALLRGAALWTLLSGRMLLEEVRSVEAALGHDLDDGRRAVGRIVSRDVDGLDAAGVRMAALESLAENTSDSVVAPLLWFAVGGLPAAAVYRYANTADASWGRLDERWRWAGTVAARADDVLNLVPARLTGLAFAAGRLAFDELRRSARTTPSPNAGWPMAALALRLGIRLDKHDSYTLHAAGRLPQPADTARALRLTAGVMALALGAALVGGGRPCRR